MKKIIAIVLCMVLSMGILAMTASAADETVTIYVQAPSSWSKVCLYWWPNSPAGTGVTMTKGSDGWYYAEMPASGVDGFLINNGNWGSGNQTADIAPQGKNLWITVDASCSYVVSTSKPAGEVEIPKRTVYAQVPDSWSAAYMYYWQGGVSWPGTKMTKGSDGWYSADLPVTGVEGVIINNGSGVQTSDIKGDKLPASGDFWVQVASDNTFTVSTSKPSGGAQEVAMREIYVHAPEAWATVNLYGWAADNNAFSAWPGTEMTKGEDGWYKVEFPMSMVNLIVNNGTEQTADIVLDAAQKDLEKLWIVVNSDKTFSVHDSKPVVEEDEGDEPSVDPVGKITVHAKVPAHWEHVNVWAWGPNGNAFPNWPGEAMTKGDDGWYTFEIPADMTGLLLNFNGDEHKTGDVTLEPGKEVWLTVEQLEDGSYAIHAAYESPKTGDGFAVASVVTAVLFAGVALVTTVCNKKKFF